MLAAAIVAAATQVFASPLQLTPEAFRTGLEKVCLPVASGEDAGRIATELKLRPLPDKLLPNRISPKDRAWYLPAAEPVLAVAWNDGSCSVQRLRGDPADLQGVMAQVLRPRPEGFKPGRMDEPAPGLRRVVYCSAQRPYPLVVTDVSARPGAPNRMSTSSTVFRSHTPGEPEFCIFNGVQTHPQ